MTHRAPRALTASALTQPSTITTAVTIDGARRPKARTSAATTIDRQGEVLIVDQQPGDLVP
jgi:hypothetical protein